MNTLSGLLANNIQLSIYNKNKIRHRSFISTLGACTHRLRTIKINSNSLCLLTTEYVLHTVLSVLRAFTYFKIIFYCGKKVKDEIYPLTKF